MPPKRRKNAEPTANLKDSELASLKVTKVENEIKTKSKTKKPLKNVDEHNKVHTNDEKHIPAMTTRIAIDSEDEFQESPQKIKTELNNRSTRKRKFEDESLPTTNEIKKPKVERLKKNNVALTLKFEIKSEATDDNMMITIGRHLKTNKYVGAHTSIAGGLFKAIEEAERLGATSIGMFLKSQRTWKSKELEDKSIKLFKEKLQSSGILPEMIIPHGSYLLNCGSANEEILQKSRICLVDELKRCELLGIPMYNFHPGSAKDSTPDKCIELIAETINMAHSQTTSVITLVENMSNQGSTIGGDFNQLKSIIDKVKDKSRIGICFDTCHAFAAGYDMRSEEGYEKTKREFDEIVGRKYLKAVHLNDSKGDVGCHLDRHENIGKGKLGLDFFTRLMNDPFFDDVALVLETPEGDYKAEIDLLYSLCK